MKIFICPACGQPVLGFNPGGCRCGHIIPEEDGAYQFTGDPAILPDGPGRKWLGYENVGENYEPGLVLCPGNDDFGMFGACGRELAVRLGKDCVALDLGCGLGQAAIPLALAGVKTIAADISQNMLKYAVQRAKKHGVREDRIVFARMNGYRLSLADASLDAVLAIDMLHQVDAPELVAAEIYRALKPGGFVVRYGSKGLPVSLLKGRQNRRYMAVESDIRRFYRSKLEEGGYSGKPFDSSEKAGNCLPELFGKPEIWETGTIHNWSGNIAFGLHKIKTRANGASQLIDARLHDAAWRETHEYAAAKYGADYDKIKRYLRFSGYVEAYKKRTDAPCLPDPREINPVF